MSGEAIQLGNHQCGLLLTPKLKSGRQSYREFVWLAPAALFGDAATLILTNSTIDSDEDLQAQGSAFDALYDIPKTHTATAFMADSAI